MKVLFVFGTSLIIVAIILIGIFSGMILNKEE